jgi:hypothetical protein
MSAEDNKAIVGRWFTEFWGTEYNPGGGTHTGPAFDELPVGSLPAASGKQMRFTGTTVLRLKDGLIAERSDLTTASPS